MTVRLQKSDLLHHPQESFHPTARETTSGRGLQQNTPESHRRRIGHTKRDQGLNRRKEQIERTDLMTVGQDFSSITQRPKLNTIETHSGRKNDGNMRASEKAMGDRENGFESTVSIGVGCCFFPLGTLKLVRVDGRRDVSCGSWLPVTNLWGEKNLVISGRNII